MSYFNSRFSPSLIIIIFIISAKSKALEVDTDIRVRIISISKSKRTLLLNKGSEEDLKIGDQGVFYIKKGRNIARAVVRKLSPSRSLWSVFKIYKKEQFDQNLVLNLRISSSVKLTSDSSRDLLGGKKYISGSDEKIPYSPIEGKQAEKKKSKRTFPFIPKGVDFSSLNEFTENKRDPNIDWSSLDSEEKLLELDTRSGSRIFREYKNLEESNLFLSKSSNEKSKKISSAFKSLETNQTGERTPKEIEEEFKNLEDFIY